MTDITWADMTARVAEYNELGDLFSGNEGQEITALGITAADTVDEITAKLSAQEDAVGYVTIIDATPEQPRAIVADPADVARRLWEHLHPHGVAQ